MITNGVNRLQRLRAEMDELFDQFFGRQPEYAWAAFPALNVWEDDQHLYAEAELPGMTMDDLEVYVVGNELTLKGERKPYTEDGVTYHRRERGVGSFSRVLRLPVEVEAEKVEAVLCNGVLTIKLPKAASARPRKIEVKALAN